MEVSEFTELTVTLFPNCVGELNAYEDINEDDKDGTTHKDIEEVDEEVKYMLMNSKKDKADESVKEEQDSESKEGQATRGHQMTKMMRKMVKMMKGVLTSSEDEEEEYDEFFDGEVQEMLMKSKNGEADESVKEEQGPETREGQASKGHQMTKMMRKMVKMMRGELKSSEDEEEEYDEFVDDDVKEDKGNVEELDAFKDTDEEEDDITYEDFDDVSEEDVIDEYTDNLTKDDVINEEDDEVSADEDHDDIAKDELIDEVDTSTEGVPAVAAMDAVAEPSSNEDDATDEVTAKSFEAGFDHDFDATLWREEMEEFLEEHGGVLRPRRRLATKGRRIQRPPSRNFQISRNSRARMPQRGRPQNRRKRLLRPQDFAQERISTHTSKQSNVIPSAYLEDPFNTVSFPTADNIARNVPTHRRPFSVPTSIIGQLIFHSQSQDEPTYPGRDQVRLQRAIPHRQQQQQRRRQRQQRQNQQQQQNQRRQRQQQQERQLRQQHLRQGRPSQASRRPRQNNDNKSNANSNQNSRNRRPGKNQNRAARRPQRQQVGFRFLNKPL